MAPMIILLNCAPSQAVTRIHTRPLATRGNSKAGGTRKPMYQAWGLEAVTKVDWFSSSHLVSACVLLYTVYSRRLMEADCSYALLLTALSGHVVHEGPSSTQSTGNCLGKRTYVSRQEHFDGSGRCVLSGSYEQVRDGATTY